MLCARAPWITLSSTAKSNFPSRGSIWFQETPARTVLSPFCIARRDQTSFMYSMPVALELLNSPASARNGLPSTINWVAVPCFRKWGISEAAAAATAGAGAVWPWPATRPGKHTSVQHNKTLRFMTISFAFATSCFSHDVKNSLGHR